jgi:hypothetical protein
MEIKSIHPLTRFFLFCAGSSMDVLQQCPRSEWIKHTGIGVSVFFTGLLAALSSFYAFRLIFPHALVSFILAIIWGLVIFNLDRYIVSSFRIQARPSREFFQAIPRLLMAVAIALVISKPLELEIFKEEIQHILFQQKSRLTDSLVKSHQNKLAIWDKKSTDLKAELKSYFDIKEGYYRDYICECDGTCGTGQKGRGVECLTKKEKYEAFTVEFEKTRQRIEAALEENEREKKNAAAVFDQNRSAIETSFSFGFLARLDALSTIPSLASIAVTLLLVMIEITPILTKLLSSKGPYDHLVQMGDHSYKVKYIQSVYAQQQELYQSAKMAAASQQTSATPQSQEKSRSASAQPSEERYRKLKEEIQNRKNK